MKKSFALVLALAMSLTGASALAAEKVTVRFGECHLKQWRKWIVRVESI